MASRFWVGGTGTWDSTTTTHWSASTGGAGGASAPTAGDTITFDANSGGGTVTVDSTIDGLTFNTITMGDFTGTFDNTVNNASMTLGGTGGVAGLNISGTGTRTIKLGSGTYTLKTTSNNCFNATTTTNLTFNAADNTGTFNIVTNGAGFTTQDFIPGSLTFANMTYNVTRRTDGSCARINGSTTFKAITFSGTGYGALDLPPGGTVTVVDPLVWAGSASGPLFIFAHQFPTTSKGTLAVAVGSAIDWGIIGDTAFTGTTVLATNSFSLGNNSGVTITAPAAGAVGVIGS